MAKKVKRVTRTFTINEETDKFLKHGIPNIKNGNCIDELVRLQKEKVKNNPDGNDGE